MAPPPPPTEIAPGLVFGSTGRRFVAFLIDRVILIIIGLLLGFTAVAVFGTDYATTVGSEVLIVAISLGYFVWTWRSSARATPGMRLLKLQVGNAFDGRTLTTDQAVRRWVALGEPLALLSVVPALVGIGGLVVLGWSLTLLFTTATSPTKQGLHDRFANSAMVEPIGVGNAALVGCVVLLVLVFVVLPVISIIALVIAGSAVTEILSAVGSPAPSLVP